MGYHGKGMLESSEKATRMTTMMIMTVVLVMEIVMMMTGTLMMITINLMSIMMTAIS